MVSLISGDGPLVYVSAPLASSVTVTAGQRAHMKVPGERTREVTLDPGVSADTSVRRGSRRVRAQTTRKNRRSRPRTTRRPVPYYRLYVRVSYRTPLRVRPLLTPGRALCSGCG